MIWVITTYIFAILGFFIGYDVGCKEQRESDRKAHERDCKFCYKMRREYEYE